VEHVAGGHGVAGQGQGVAGQGERRDGAVGDQLGDLAAGDVNLEQRVVADVLGGDVQAAAVVRYHDAARRTVPVRRDLAALAGRQVQRGQRVAVRLEAGPGHRAVIQRAAV